MNKNTNTPYQIECALPAVQQSQSGLSIFSLQQPIETFIEQNQVSRCLTFAAFVNSRNQYLTRLRSLGDNWISGTSKQPTDQSINHSKNLLINLENWYSNIGHKSFIYPKVIMSPTPAGGIAIEIEVFPELRAFINILNDKVEYEVETNGHFVEFAADKDNIASRLLTLYNTKENGYVIETQSAP
jgi:hypothetical protein